MGLYEVVLEWLPGINNVAKCYVINTHYPLLFLLD
jgi:hypothetical protein